MSFIEYSLQGDQLRNMSSVFQGKFSFEVSFLFRPSKHVFKRTFQDLGVENWPYIGINQPLTAAQQQFFFFLLLYNQHQVCLADNVLSLLFSNFNAIFYIAFKPLCYIFVAFKHLCCKYVASKPLYTRTYIQLFKYLTRMFIEHSM